MKKAFLGPPILLVLTLSLFAQSEFLPRFELHAMGGYGLSQFRGDSAYVYNWNYEQLRDVLEDTRLSMKANNAAFFTGGVSYFFHPNVGIQIGGGYFLSKLAINGVFDFSWIWMSSLSGSESKNWAGDGKMSTLPLFLNIVGKFKMDRVNVFLTAGPAFYLNSFEANSFVGYGATLYYEYFISPDWYYDQSLDAFQIPASISKTSWTAFGANFGFGIDIEVSPNVAITAEGRYFLVPKKSLSWEWTPGTYDGIFEILQGTFTEDDFADFQKEMTTLDVKPSFFSFALGLRLTFGQK